MQEIWEYGLGFDEELTTELKNKWETRCSQVCILNDLTLERKYFPYPLDKGDKHPSGEDLLVDESAQKLDEAISKQSSG
ncbi:hypothetical protein TNCV_2206681 [Trichonephila clavipes]|uniref:Uncharacterized protein n=1 Tax=Trichonephila clavipes TaxID=2585209 RepID=A0A8X6S0I5_TRICX|nr:hypothetical protein TNCV_2206681 [Trichonephila clavipes]